MRDIELNVVCIEYEAIVAETALVHDAIWISLHENSDNSGITAEMFADQFMETDYMQL